MMNTLRKLALLCMLLLVGIIIPSAPSVALDNPEIPSGITKPQDYTDIIAPDWQKKNKPTTAQTPKATENSEVPEGIAKPKDYLENISPEWNSYAKQSAPREAAVPSTNGLMSDEILQKMHQFMLKTNEALHAVMMIGDGLMCYATEVHYHELNGQWYNPLPRIKFPDFDFLIVGFVIYALGVFMAFSIGMYFMDIALKLGFAIVFMPISIALWPFPPTKNKFADNLSTIIRNSLLFALVGIGVTFAVKLINSGLLADGSASDFWSAIENDEVEQLSNSFSFFSTHILVVLFALAYGFKILEGSVNNYLNTLFGDSSFGSESPMHHMGTQAVGMATENLGKPALSFAKDVATHQTGRAIAGIGRGTQKVFSKEGRAEIGDSIKSGYGKVKGGIKNTAHAIANPRETFNKGAQAAGAAANKAVHAAGNFAKGAHDAITSLAPTIGARESWRQAQVDAFNKLIDKGADKLGNKLENGIAHGGGAIKDAVKQHQNVKNANQLLDNLGAGGEAQQAARAQLEQLGLDPNAIQQAMGANGAGRENAVNQIATQMQQIDQQKRMEQRSGGKKGGADGADKDSRLAQEQTEALLNYQQNEEHKINKELQPLIDEIADKPKQIEKDYLQKMQQADQLKQEEYAAIDNDSSLTAEQKKQKKTESDLKNQQAHNEIDKERQEGLKSVEALKKNVETQKLQHLHNFMKKKTGAEAYEHWNNARAADGDQYAQEELMLNSAKEKTQTAEQTLQQAVAAQKTAEQNYKFAKDYQKHAPDALKGEADAELKQAEEALKSAQERLRLARSELDKAQDEYLRAISQSQTQMSGAAKTVKKAQIIYKQADNAPISLTPFKGLKTLYQAVRHPVDSMEKLANNMEAIQNADGRIIVKKAGQVIIRSGKDLGRDAVKVVDTTGSIFGKILENFGNGLADNSSHNRLSAGERRAAREKAERERLAREADERERNREMTGD